MCVNIYIYIDLPGTYKRWKYATVAFSNHLRPEVCARKCDP